MNVRPLRHTHIAYLCATHIWSAYLCATHIWSAYLCVFQTYAEVCARDSTKPVSHQRCLQIRIQFHRHRGRWCFHVRIINGILDRVLMVTRRAYRSISLMRLVPPTVFSNLEMSLKLSLFKKILFNRKQKH